MESHSPVSILIAAPDGVMGSSLRTFLQTIPEVRLSAQASTRSEMLKKASRVCVQIALIDADLANGDLGAMLRELRRAAPALRLILLTNTTIQQQEARLAGAEFALLKGFLSDQLRGALCSDPPDTGPPLPA